VKRALAFTVEAMAELVQAPAVGGGVVASGGFGLSGLTNEVKKHERTRPTTAAVDDFNEAEEVVLVEWAWLLIQKRRLESYSIKFALHSLFLVLFVVAFTLLRPVSSTFGVQDSLLEHTSGEPSAGFRASWERSFAAVSGDGEWWQWVETALVPTIFSESYYNGDSRLDSHGSRFANTVSMYNTQTARVRFRTARVKDDSCDTPASAGGLARPCWGDFSADNQYKEPFGTSYANRYVQNLNAVSANDGSGVSYGNEGYVVDVALSQATAIPIVEQMRADNWINEQTRVAAIESNWYNANLDLSTYVRWQVDFSPGGRVHASTVMASCRLSPYSRPEDMLRAGLEVFCFFLVLYFWIDVLLDVRTAKLSYFSTFWNYVELAHVLCYTAVVICWVTYVLSDKTPFEVVNQDTYEKRPQLSGVAEHFNYTANLAAFGIILTFIKVIKYLQMFGSFRLLWQTFGSASTDLLPFIVVFLLFMSGFSVAGHWIFGAYLPEFHTPFRAFTSLFLATASGFPYDAMARAAPLSAPIYATVWTLVLAMVLANMFVAILTEYYRQVSVDMSTEDSRLSSKIGEAARDYLSPQVFTRCFAMIPGVGGSVTVDEQFAGIVQQTSTMLRNANLQNVEHIWTVLCSGNDLFVGELSQHFGGDTHRAYLFAEKLKELQIADAGKAVGDASDEDGGGTAEVEHEEQEQLRGLQRTVERMDEQLEQLRSALRHSGAAPVQQGQSKEGYLLVPASRPASRPPPATDAIPGVVPSLKAE